MIRYYLKIEVSLDSRFSKDLISYMDLSVSDSSLSKAFKKAKKKLSKIYGLSFKDCSLISQSVIGYY